MKIAILGTGNVGRTLGAGWSRRGHAVVFGSRDPDGEKSQAAVAAAGGRAASAGLAQAAAEAELAVLAVPWPAVPDVLAAVGAQLAGKVLVDATNPMAPGLKLAVGHTTSGAEQVAGWAPGARVVKAFNTTGVETMADPVYAGQAATLFICGDDAAAKTAVAGLAEALGFEVADVGGLTQARLIEPLALVWIQLAIGQKQGRQIAFRLMRR